MEDLMSQLNKLGYKELIYPNEFADGPPSNAFVKVVSWLSSELTAFCHLESHVSSSIDPDDCIGFLVEVSSLLKELCCPLKKLTQGQISDRLLNATDKLHLITYLCTELEAARILIHKNPKKTAPIQIELEESKTAKELKDMLICLRFGKPPDSITPQQLFGQVEKKLKSLSQPAAPNEIVGELLFTGYLTEKQWFQLEYLYKEMFEEYKTRRNLLLTRLDVTIKSFAWADRLKNQYEAIMNVYNMNKSGLKVEPCVKISHVLAAKPDLAVIEKTSCASVRKNTKSAKVNIVIGAVPDRGGRPEEQQPPPPEVPSWQKDSNRGGMKSQQSSSSYKGSGYSRDENSNTHSTIDTGYKDNYSSSRGNYRGGRNDYNPAPPSYATYDYTTQLGNLSLGFGGYMPAGDNFQQYGIPDGTNQYQMQYQPRPPRGSGPRFRGGFSDRGSNQSRPSSRRRGRY